MHEQFIIGAIVKNHFGVLTRVSSLFARRGYNIDSLVVGVTDDPAYSRMTIVVNGDDAIREQIVKQLRKLHDVERVGILARERTTVREHMLIKLRVADGNNAEIADCINRFGAKVVDFSKDSITAEVTGENASNDSFITLAKQYGILEICRAGAQALARGEELL